jgi:hypothetical protein
MSTLLLILAIVAAAIFGVLTDWILKSRLPERPSLKNALVALVVCVILVLVIVLPSVFQSDSTVVIPATLAALQTKQAQISQQLNTPDAQGPTFKATGTAIAKEIATLRASLLYTLVVDLPGAHAPPIAFGGARLNFQLSTPASPKQAFRVQIPSINVDASVVQGDDWEHLKMGVGQKIGSSNPGEKGVVIFSAFNDVFGEVFRHIDELAIGDSISLYSTERAYTYTVNTTEIVDDLRASLTFS